MRVEQILSLESLGYPRHYIGLTWRVVEGDAERNKNLQGILKKHNATHGIVTTGVDRDQKKVHSVGIAPKLEKKYYSAAALVAEILTSESKTDPNAVTDAVFVQKLKDGRYWYLLILERVPAPGDNDLILDSVESVQKRIYADMHSFGFENYAIRYYLPTEIKDAIGNDFSEISSQKVMIDYQQIIEVAGENFKSFQIKELKRIADRSSVSVKNIILASILIASTSWVLFDLGSSPKKKDTVYINDSIFSSPAANLSNPTDDKQLDLEEDKRLAELQEAKWIGQKLALSNPVNILTGIQKYVDKIPVDVKGWFPKDVKYSISASISDNKSSATHSPDLILSKVVSVNWSNTDSTINEFRNSVELNGKAVYEMNGTNIELTESTPVDLSDVEFDVADVNDFLDHTENLYLDLMSSLQDFKLKNPDSFTWTMTPKNINNRIVSYVRSDKSKFDSPLLPYTNITITTSFKGYGVGYKTFKEFNSVFAKYPMVIVNNITIDLLSEEITIVADYMQQNQSVNYKG